MRTLLLRIGALNPDGSGHPLELYELADPATGAMRPVAEALMPALPAPGDDAQQFGAGQMVKAFTGDKAPSARLKAIGQQLYAAVAQGQIGAELDRVFAPGPPPQIALGLQLDAPMLQGLPWELLCRDGRWLSIRARLFRVPPQPAPPTLRRPAAEHSWPLRVLVVVGVGPVGAQPGGARDGEVDAEAELGLIGDALVSCDADIDLRVIERKGPPAILGAIREFRPHVLHFIGHGGLEPGGGGQPDRPYLQLFVEETGRTERWYAEQIDGKIWIDPDPAEALRLAVLNACRTGSSPGPDRRDHSSLSKIFLDAGVPAVLGMSSDVADRRAALFASGFYQELARLDRGLGGSLPRALLEARGLVQNSETDGSRFREWAAPYLITTVEPEDLIRVSRGAKATADRRAELSKDPDLQWARRYVGRREHRYKIWRHFLPERPKITAVIGPAGAGKSSFVRMLMERCALSGHLLRYLDMGGLGRAGKKVDFLDVLLTIRWGQPDLRPLLSAPLPAADFAEFHDLLARWSGQPVDPNAPPDLPSPLPDELQKGVEVERLFAAFRDGLDRASAASPPLVLVLDHLAIAESDFDRIEQWLLVPYVGSKATLFVLLYDEDRLHVRRHDPRLRADVYAVEEVRGFRRDDWMPLAVEYGRRNRDCIDPDHETPLEIYLKMARELAEASARLRRLDDPWYPRRLYTLFYG